MAKLFAILNVVAWAGFWAFGYIALTSDVTDSGKMTIAAILAFAGGAVGVFTYLRLVRYCERTGYSQAPKRAYPSSDDGDAA